MIKKFILFVVISLSCLVLSMLWKMNNLSSKQIDVPKIDKVNLDIDLSINNLSEAITYRTISNQDNGNLDAMTFLSFHKYIRRTYPKTFEKFSERIFSGYSMLLKWESNSGFQGNPILLMAHMDVVPEGDITNWDNDPFSGAIDNESIFGRGAIDNKSSLIAILESFEYLISSGFQPNRDIYLSFGHDEENGGMEGNAVIAQTLREEGVYFDMVLDEGSIISDGLISAIDEPIALIGIAEKGYVTMEMTSSFSSGHSSMPGKSTTIGKLANAISNLEKFQMKPHLSDPVKNFFEFVAPELSNKDKFIIANSDLLSMTILNELIQNPITASMVRTTVAPTMISSGIKSNVLPSIATATLNFRVSHGDTIEEVERHIYDVVKDKDIKVNIVDEIISSNPSKVSSIDSPFFNLIHKTIKEIYSNVLVAPSLVVATTDSRYYQSISKDIYRFNPIKINNKDLSMIHGYNEKIPISDYLDMIQFYIQLIKNINVI